MKAAPRSVFSDVFGKVLAPTECLADGVSKTQAIQVGGAARMLGEPPDIHPMTTRFIYVDDESSIPLQQEVVANLSNTRRNQPGRAPEWRLGYSKHNPVMSIARGGDLVWIAKTVGPEEHLWVMVAPAGGDAAKRLDRIFETGLLAQEEIPGIPKDGTKLHSGSVGSGDGIDADDADLMLRLEIPLELPEQGLFSRFMDDLRELPVSPTSGMAPSSAMARLVRQYRPGDPIANPDQTLADWWNLSTELFFLYEKQVVGERLNTEFANQTHIDVDRFVSLALSILNARKSRAGSVFEEHLEAIFQANDIRTNRVSRLKDGSRPDFVFPSKEAFESDGVDNDLLTFLGAKTSAKERWRQQIGEATRITERHFATVDPDITTSSLATMSTHHVIPVIPAPVIARAYPGHEDSIWTIQRFVGMVRAKQVAFTDGDQRKLL